LKHIRAAYLLGKRICSARGLAAHYGVTKRTIYRWSELALTYEDDEAEGLRRELRRD
jgi:predicted DNA-binding transcriptional regulator YafY